MHCMACSNHWISPVDQSGCFTRATAVFNSTKKFAHDKPLSIWNFKGITCREYRKPQCIVHIAVDQAPIHKKETDACPLILKAMWRSIGKMVCPSS